MSSGSTFNQIGGGGYLSPANPQIPLEVKHLLGGQSLGLQIQTQLIRYLGPPDIIFSFYYPHGLYFRWSGPPVNDCNNLFLKFNVFICCENGKKTFQHPGGHLACGGYQLLLMGMGGALHFMGTNFTSGGPLQCQGMKSQVFCTYIFSYILTLLSTL